MLFVASMLLNTRRLYYLNTVAIGVVRFFSLTVMALLMLIWVSCPAMADKNLMPRLPEFVIEKGHSDSFEVTECNVSSHVAGDEAQSTIKVVLKNVSSQRIESSLKVRILYLLGEQNVSVSVNGKAIRFDRRDPRVAFSLDPGQELTISLKAKQNILYNLDATKDTSKDQRPLSKRSSGGKSAQNVLDDLKRFFERENLGRRYMIGPIVSKWGIFPVPFKRVKLEITVPSDFEGVFSSEQNWKKTKRGPSNIFTFEGTDGFSGTVFLPRQDVAAFQELQEQAKPASHSLSISY